MVRTIKQRYKTSCRRKLFANQLSGIPSEQQEKQVSHIKKTGGLTNGDKPWYKDKPLISKHNV